MVVDHPLREGLDVRICRLVESHAAELYLRHVLECDVTHELVVASGSHRPRRSRRRPRRPAGCSGEGGFVPSVFEQPLMMTAMAATATHNSPLRLIGSSLTTAGIVPSHSRCKAGDVTRIHGWPRTKVGPRGRLQPPRLSIAPVPWAVVYFCSANTSATLDARVAVCRQQRSDRPSRTGSSEAPRPAWTMECDQKLERLPSRSPCGPPLGRHCTQHHADQRRGDSCGADSQFHRPCSHANRR